MNTKKGTDVNISNMTKKQLLILSNRIDKEIEDWESGERRRNEILNMASEFFELRIRYIKGNNRNRRIADIRKIISCVMRNEKNTITSIASTLDCHHATVIYQLNEFQQLLKYDYNFKDMYEGFTNFIYKNDETGEIESAEAKN